MITRSKFSVYRYLHKRIGDEYIENIENIPLRGGYVKMCTYVEIVEGGVWTCRLFWGREGGSPEKPKISIP